MSALFLDDGLEARPAAGLTAGDVGLVQRRGRSHISANDPQHAAG